MNILIAEDDVLVRMDVKEILRENDYDVVADVGNGYDALKRCEEGDIDVAILDIRMPGLDGLSTAKVLSERNLVKCIIMATGYSAKDYVRKASEACVMGYIAKPITEKNLLPELEISISTAKRMDSLHESLKTKEKELEKRTAIDKAKKIIMKNKRFNENDAYNFIRKRSMDGRMTILEVCKGIIENDC